MSFSFDELIDRSGTRSLKWTAYGRDVLPLWVADMDFRAPEPVLEALRAAVEHGILGYEMPQRKLAETVAARMARLYGWQVSPEWVLPIPGVVAGFHMAARAACRAGEGILVQPPVYPPFLHVAGNTGCVCQHAPLQAAAERHVLRYAIDWPVFEQAFNSGDIPAPSQSRLAGATDGHVPAVSSAQSDRPGLRPSGTGANGRYLPAQRGCHLLR